MKLSRGREYKLNMGNYEHLQVSAMVTVDILDLFDADVVEDMTPKEQMAALREFAEEHLEQQLTPELTKASEMSQAEKSILPEPEREAPRRTEKAKRRSTR